MRLDGTDYMEPVDRSIILALVRGRAERELADSIIWQNLAVIAAMAVREYQKQADAIRQAGR